MKEDELRTKIKKLEVALHESYQGYLLETVIPKLENKNKQLQAELEKKNEIIEKYGASARIIALYLDDFCNRYLPYDEMIADAARKISDELEKVKHKLEKAMKDIPHKCWKCAKGFYGDRGFECYEAHYKSGYNDCLSWHWRGDKETKDV